MRTLVCINRLQIYHVPHHLEFATDAIATMHIPSMSRDFQCLAAIVPFDDANHLRGGIRRVHQTTNLKRGLQAECNFRLHVGQFLLEQLRLCQRLVELLAVKTVLARGVPAELCSPKAPQLIP